MPAVLGAGKLLEECRGLKEDGVGENHDTAGRLKRPAAAQFHEVETENADLDDVAGDAANGDAIADAHAVAAHEEEMGDAGENDRLQRDGDARR